MKKIYLKNDLYCLVDDDDFEKMSKYKWHFQTAGKDYFYGYAYSVIDGKRIGMHRLIIGAQAKNQVDHINCNPLDNQKNNLRICTNQQNGFNRRKIKPFSSLYKGVFRVHRNGRYAAQIRLNGEPIRIGTFYKQKDAALAYNRKAIELFGEFANLNVINS